MATNQTGFVTPTTGTGSGYAAGQNPNATPLPVPAWKKRKGGRQGTGRPDVAVDWQSAGEMEAQRQNNGVMPVVPAWQSNVLNGGTANTFTPPAWNINQPMPTGSFFAGAGQQVRMGEATGGARVVNTKNGTRMVRTGNNTMTPVPAQPGMLTGTFFSGGTPAPQQVLPTYPTGTFFAAGGNMVRGPGMQLTSTTTNSDPFSSYYKGYGGGGGGGGGYARTPSWLQNLYNWNFKG